LPYLLQQLGLGGLVQVVVHALLLGAQAVLRLQHVVRARVLLDPHRRLRERNGGAYSSGIISFGCSSKNKLAGVTKHHRFQQQNQICDAEDISAGGSALKER